jgi:hypothetical protein
LGSLQPLPQAPLSDLALRLRDALVTVGVSEESASLIATGNFEQGQDVADLLPDEDLEALYRAIKEETIFYLDDDQNLFFRDQR